MSCGCMLNTAINGRCKSVTFLHFVATKKSVYGVQINWLGSEVTYIEGQDCLNIRPH